MKVGRFILIHNLLLYSLGFAGSLILKKRYGLSWLSFGWFFVLFNFNGYITAHLSAGHSMWSGYFLLPFFCLYVLQWAEKPTAYAAPLKLALVLLAMLLQGSFHLVTWCWMFLGLMLLFSWKMWKQGLVFFVMSGLLSSWRLIPTAVAFWGFEDYRFLGGYSSLKALARAFIWIGESTEFDPIVRLRWWEYDLYLGVLGSAALVYFGIWKRFDPNLTAYRFSLLDMPLLGLALLAFDSIYQPIYQLNLPILNGERVSSRFLIIPVVMLFALAAIRMEQVLRSAHRQRLVIGFGAIALLSEFVNLCYHSWVWSIPRVEQIKESHWHPFQAALLVTKPDDLYKLSIPIGAALTALALIAWVYLYRRLDKVKVNEKRSKPEPG